MIFISCLLVSHTIMTSHPDWDWVAPPPWKIVGMEHGGDRGNAMHKYYMAEDGTPIPEQCDQLVIRQQYRLPKGE